MPPAAATAVLIADDDAAQRRLLRHYVRRWGYEVVEASDGEQALRILRESQIALAVLDWDMPGLTGIEVCGQLRSLERFVHAIVLTASSERGKLGEALAAGASDFLVKPMDPVELEARLRVGQRVLTLLGQLAHQQKMQSVGSLAAGIAHEINTPAQSVLSNLQFLGDAWTDLEPVVDVLARLSASASEEETARLLKGVHAAGGGDDLEFLRKEIPAALQEARRSIETVARIVGAVREFAGASETNESHLRVADLNAIAEDASVLTRSAWQSSADLDMSLEPDLPPVPCATGPLLQALCQLLINAGEAIARRRKTGSPARGRITLRTSHDDTHAEVRIADDGTGIAPEIRARVFDPFFTTKNVGQGMGQGLAQVHSVIVGQHRGSVHFETEPGQGTTFIVRLQLLVG